MKKRILKKCILWFFGHIVVSLGISCISSQEFKLMLFGEIFNPSSPEFNTATTVLAVVGGIAIAIGVIMIVPFWIEVFKRLPFMANKTVKGAGKVIKKIGEDATKSVDRMEEEKGLEKLQRAHGLIKDKKSNNGGSSSTNNTEEYEYYVDDVSKSQVEDEMKCVCKYATDLDLAKVTLDSYTISKNGDGTFDIDIYLSTILYGTTTGDDVYTYQAVVEKLANRIINNISERVAGLGCGFSIIPHFN